MRAFTSYRTKVPRELTERVNHAMEHAVEAIRGGNDAAYDECVEELSRVQPKRWI